MIFFKTFLFFVNFIWKFFLANYTKKIYYLKIFKKTFCVYLKQKFKTHGNSCFRKNYLCYLRDAMACQWSSDVAFLFTSVTGGTLYRVFDHQVIYRECYGFERALFTLKRFLAYTPFCFSRLPRVGSSTSKEFMLWASCCGSKHGSGTTISLNRTTINKHSVQKNLYLIMSSITITTCGEKSSLQSVPSKKQPWHQQPTQSAANLNIYHQYLFENCSLKKYIFKIAPLKKTLKIGLLKTHFI